MINNILILFFLVVSGNVFCQVTYEERLEIELRNGYGNERITQFDELGFILNSKKEDITEGQREWKFDMYDTELKLNKSATLLIDRKYAIDEIAVIDNRLHTLYKTKKGEYILHSIQAGSLTETKIEGELPKSTTIKDMVIMGDFAYFYARQKKLRFLYVINWRTGDVQKGVVDIPDYSTISLKLIRFQVLEANNEVLLFIRASKNKKESEVYVLRYDGNGERKGKFKLTENVENNFSSISASPLGENHYVFTGTYSSKRSSLSEGLFFCEAEDDKMSYVEYYNFTDLENFLKYLPERKQEKIEKKKQRKEDAGKELKINYLIAEHPIIQLNDGYLFLGEAYYPTYRTEFYTTYVNGSPVTKTKQVFDGFQYTHAVLAKFNKFGEMVWDEIFEMWPSYKPFRVKRFISIADGKQDALNVVFASRGQITSKSFDFDGNVLSDETSELIETNVEGDQTKRSFSNITYWYDKYFLAYGSQTIKNKQEGSKRKRKVYFLSKIRFE
ncbi:MAG: hypothetical protein ACI8ZM_002449 [Crocinitomix sp.]|jgi:hypothetical protein